MSKFLQSLGRRGKDLVKKTMTNQDDRGTSAAASDSGSQFNIIHNATFADGTQGWYGQGCSIDVGNCGGSTYGIAHGRRETWDGLAQEIGQRLETDVEYRVEAWVGIGEQAEEAPVQGTVKLESSSGGDEYIWIGSVRVTKGKWTLLSGKLRVSKVPDKAIFYLEGPSNGIDILVSSVAIIPPGAPITQAENNVNDRPQTLETQTSKTETGHPRGLVQNPGFVDGLRNWREKNCKMYLSESMDGGRIRPPTGKCFAVASNRREAWQGIEQEVTGRIEESMKYTVAGLVRINGNVAEANVMVTMYMKGKDGKDQYITLAKTQASNTQWTELKGQFLVNTVPKLAIIYFEGPPPGVDILIDNFGMFIPVRAKPAGPPVFKDPKFGVNIIENTNLENSLAGWYAMGSCHLTISSGSPVLLGANAAKSFIGTQPPVLTGKFIYVSNRTQVWEGPAQTITQKIELFKTYQVTAWVATALPRGSHGVPMPQKVNVAFGVDGQWRQGGEVFAGSNWTEVSGSMRLESKPENVIIYFQGPSPGVDVMVAGLHIFAVDRLARVPLLRRETDRVRKCDVVVRLHDTRGHPLAPGTHVSVQQTKNSFPIGTCINSYSLENKGYTKFFLENFNWAVFENELKWGWTEPNKGELKYEDADGLVEFCNSNNIPMRGHCIVWETEDTVQEWLKGLDAGALSEAVQNRVTGLLTRYQGQFKHYDVNNEMLHGSYYKDALGPQVLPYLFKLAHQFDPQATLFVNDYHVVDGEDANSSPQKYIQQIQWLQANGAPVGGIGLQGHLNVPVGPIIAQALDELSSLGLPIWFTEVDVESVNEHLRADDLEVLFREAYAHPSVGGIVLWGFWEGMYRKDAHLVELDKRVNEAGRRFIALKKEWLTSFQGVTNDHGQLVFRGFPGDYIVSVQGREIYKTFTVTKRDGASVVDVSV